MIRRYRLAAVIMAALSLLGCSDKGEQSGKLLGTAAGCDAAIESCRIDAGAIHVTLTLGPNVKPLVSFPVQLQIEGGKVTDQSVIADFQMQGMDMGMNRYRLQAMGGAAWHGKATLPVCTASRMDWQAIVEFSLDGEPYRVVFPFHTEVN